MSAPKPGDRVKVSYEAEWSNGWPIPDAAIKGHVRIGEYVHTVPQSATVEVLASPVYVNHDTTEYREGDVVRSGSGGVCVYKPTTGRDHYAPWLILSEPDFDPGIPRYSGLMKPLTLLVRGGQVIA